MGYSISWLVTSGADAQTLPERLGLKPTGEKGDFFDFKASGQPLKNGGYLLVMERCDHPFIRDESMARISADGEALACSLEEHVMYAGASQWKQGKKLWSITHQGNREETRYAITVTGAPPGPFAAIRDDCAKKQLSDKQVDWYFEIPLQLAKQLTGFKHDENCTGIDGNFAEFAEPVGAAKPWWRFWG